MTGLTLAKQTAEPITLTAALSALERGGVLTELSLDLEDPDMDFDTWIALGEALRRVRNANSWWIGDWYIFGCHARSIGERRAAAAESVVGLSPHTLQTIVRTCMYVPKGRRNLNLPFSHHTEIARLMPEEQVKWLKLAEEGDGRSSWSREQLRDGIRFAKKRYSDSEPHWEGAIAMKRDNDVIAIAEEIWQTAKHVGTQDTESYADTGVYVIPAELMVRLGVALGEVKIPVVEHVAEVAMTSEPVNTVLDGTEEGVAA